MPEAPLVLMAEDDYQLQSLFEDCLRESGFEVHLVSSGAEALTLFTGKVAQYVVLITDVNLNGGLSGWDVARQIRNTVPDFPIIYMTGAAGNQWTSQGVPNSILLQKPFAPAQLITAVTQLLNAVTRGSNGG